MLTDTLDLLDRQIDFLLKHNEGDFFLQLPAFLAALRSEPRLWAIGEDLLAGADETLAGLNNVRRQLSNGTLRGDHLS